MKWLALFLAGCSFGPPLPPVSDEGCAPACAHLAELGCDAGKPTPDGASCESVCRNVQASGLNRINTACIMSAASCGAAEGC